MASRSALRSAADAVLRRRSGGTVPSQRRSGSTVPSQRRGFASSSHHDDAYETAKWEKITYAAIIACTILSIYNLSKGHPHYPDPPAYPYLHIRNKEFPWGPDGLFENKHADH